MLSVREWKRVRLERQRAALHQPRRWKIWVNGNETCGGRFGCAASRPCAIYSRGMQASTRNARKASWHAIGLSAVTLLLLMTPAARSQKALPAKNRPAAAKNAWVESTLRKMSLREKLGQMLMPYYFGGFTSTESASYKELLHQVEDNHVGGFILGTQRGALGIERSQVYPTAALTNELQKRAKTPL